MRSSIVCPKIRIRHGKPVQPIEGACARCRICFDNEHITQIIFPEHITNNNKGATAPVLDLFDQYRSAKPAKKKAKAA